MNRRSFLKSTLGVAVGAPTGWLVGKHYQPSDEKTQNLAQQHEVSTDEMKQAIEAVRPNVQFKAATISGLIGAALGPWIFERVLPDNSSDDNIPPPPP